MNCKLQRLVRCLDLFCGAGGAGMGYHLAGFEVVGVDINPQPDYPFEFHQDDATTFPLDGFDLIHASPPCQRYSRSTKNHALHPDLIGVMRQRLAGRCYVMENVEGAPLRRDVVLCGSMFGLMVQRHRIFEIEPMPLCWPVMQCRHEWGADPKAPYQVTGHADGSGWGARHKKYRDLAHAQELMQMPWVTTCRGITESIPPAYTRWIGEQFLSTANTQSRSASGISSDDELKK